MEEAPKAWKKWKKKHIIGRLEGINTLLKNWQLVWVPCGDGESVVSNRRVMSSCEVPCSCCYTIMNVMGETDCIVSKTRQKISHVSTLCDKNRKNPQNRWEPLGNFVSWEITLRNKRVIGKWLLSLKGGWRVKVLKLKRYCRWERRWKHIKRNFAAGSKYFKKKRQDQICF